jgi:hypothetical protein
MSILACLIGILTLMISVVIQVQQMKKAGRTEEEMALAMKNRTLIKKAEKLLKEGDLKKRGAPEREGHGVRDGKT